MKRVLAILLVMAMLFAVSPMTAFAAGKGDYNNDGAVNTRDVREMVMAAIAGTTATYKQIWWADYDQNGVINTVDARRVLKQTMKGNSTVDYTAASNTDCWGERSVAILGDSISFGAGCEGNIADTSYAGIVKKAVNAKNGSPNYGFMPAYTTNWSPRSDEICSWPEMTGGPGVPGNDQGWSETDSGDRLMYFGLTAYKQYASLTYKLRSGYKYDYFCVYYQTGPGYGTFVMSNVVDGLGYDQATVDGTVVYDCENTVNETKRTGFYRVSDFQNGMTVAIISNDNSPVTITGLGFYNDISGNYVTFNKYTRGGAMLTPLSDKVLSQAASASTLIVGLGYNDAMWGRDYNYTKESFSDRIDYLIAECKKNGTNVIVNDYLWDNYRSQASYTGCSAAVRASIDEKFVFFSQELKRLAAETNGIYIDQEARWGNELMTYVNANDGVHPLNGGHKLMAQAILEAMGLA
ncbi:MAG: hypothetical protein E7553_00640 [Ruminococcaceae bacterium]|nr:hypothetical protein [Oscillospiraceae bacterium]